jgi:hypothetical protein
VSTNPAHPRAFHPDDLVIELDGEGVHPDSVSSFEALEFAASMLHLVVQVAKRNGQRLSFSGLQIIDKCAALATRASDAETATDATQTALRLVAGVDEDRLVRTAVERVRNARTALPEGYVGRVHVGPWSASVAPFSGPPARKATSLETLRAVPVRVGGAEPAVRLRAPTEPRTFTLDATEDQARELGSHLYREVEVEAEVVRSESGEIESGRLLAFYELDPTPDVEAWGAWYRTSAARFDDVDDIEAELARD